MKLYLQEMNLYLQGLVLFLLFPCAVFAQKPNATTIKQWKQQAANITIYRDNFGVPHIYGKTDADAVFGLLYAQCEDDFKRVELNFIEKLGRLSEINGEKDLYNDLLSRLVIDSAGAIADYKKSPSWLRKILDAYADGVNYYLYTHPKVKPALLYHFQPWYPLLWTDGSISAIATGGISVREIQNFYGKEDAAFAYNPIRNLFEEEDSKTGSNGFAFAPKTTVNGHAILYINPHVTFYFRPEVHINSEEGLNAYGAVTWGQPFVYQGFNEHCGWMHTSSQADISDAYIETISYKNSKPYYLYEGKQLAVTTKFISIKYNEQGTLKTKSFKTLFTHHGPILAKRKGEYLSLRHNNRDLNGFIQSWQRTKAKSFEEFEETMKMCANPSNNNTVYADAEGNIAYWHGNFIPKRDPHYNWELPVNGSIKATEWQGVHSLSETVQSINPVNGWLQNCNSTPYTVAGKNSPLRSNYVSYMAPDGENYRGVNAVRLFTNSAKELTIDKVIHLGYDRTALAFAELVPALVKSFNIYKETISNTDSIYQQLVEPIKILSNWNFKTDTSSIATTLAIEWAQRIQDNINGRPGVDIVAKTKAYAALAGPNELLQPMLIVIKKLEKEWDTWKVSWGSINRFQRISSNINNVFKDDSTSIAVPYVSSAWGMLPSYTSRYFNESKNRYGVHGNSFVAAVEFGPRIKAKSLLAGGQSGNDNSLHFFDQGKMYSEGKFKDVLFYKEDVLKNAVRNYHPGE